MEKKTTKTDKTIDDLVKGLKPVHPVPSFGIRLAFWAASAVVLGGTFVAFFGMRRQLPEILNSWRLALDAVIVIVLALVASSSALRLSVPGEERGVDRILPMGVLVTWAVVTGAQVISATAVYGAAELIPDRHLTCAALLTSLAAVLSVPLTSILRRAAPQDRWWCGGLAGLAAGATAMVGIELICVYGKPAHQMAWHVLPVIGFSIAGFLFGPRLLAARR